MRKIRAAVSHRERLIEELRADPRLAADYLKAAIDDEDPRGVACSAAHCRRSARDGEGGRGSENPP